MKREDDMTDSGIRKIQAQGVHHITLVGADRQTSIDFWEGVLGMPFIFDQPNLDNPGEGHLYFDPGDGRLITIFTNESRKPDPTRTPTDPGCVHHIAFNVSQATFWQVAKRLDARGIKHSGPKDRGFMDSIYLARSSRRIGARHMQPACTMTSACSRDRQHRADFGDRARSPPAVAASGNDRETERSTSTPGKLPRSAMPRSRRTCPSRTPRSVSATTPSMSEPGHRAR
jgi:catechol 2,3-dioxygenase-like lactoylglutathione lyase family enzyme